VLLLGLHASAGTRQGELTKRDSEEVHELECLRLFSE
jgi:hypothetical protein